MADHALALRRGIIQALKGNSGVSALVGARIYDESPANPAWPFVRYGFPIVTPLRATAWRGALYGLSLHAFAKGPGTDACEGLASAVRAALDEIDVPIEGAGGVISLYWTQTLLLRDTPEASAYHAVVQFDAATAEIVE